MNYLGKSREKKQVWAAGRCVSGSDLKYMKMDIIIESGMIKSNTTSVDSQNLIDLKPRLI